MSRQESDREDLILEAVAMPDRGEFRIPGLDELVTVGFRSTAAMSIFIGQDPVYQFDPDGRLRRAFVEGFLYRSQHTTLARLQRVRTETNIQLQRSELRHDELSHFRTLLHQRLSCISGSIRDQTIQVMRTVPADVDLRPRIAATIANVLAADPWLSHDIRARR